MTSKPNDKRDPRDIPNYTLPEAARWLGLVANTLRVWLRGQDYTTKTGKRRAQPIVHPAGTDPPGLSFWNLVECSVLATIRNKHDVSMQKVRRALAYVRVVVVDPRVAFGQPILASTRVPVEVVFDRFRAGDTIAHLAKDYRVEPARIEDLVRKWFGPAAA